MAVYAVGDVQGCYDALCRLLECVRFDASADRLWLVGDLVNRGPQSLETLRFVRSLGASGVVVLGNHDVHLLGVAAGVRRLRTEDTLDAILAAPDREDLLRFLERQPFFHHDAELGYCMVHAGIPPHWDLQEAARHAEEARAWLTPSGLDGIIGPCTREPLELSAELSPPQRARAIVNYLTRMRVCTASGRLDLSFKGAAEKSPAGFLPWYAHPARKTRDLKILFGHWAALQGTADVPNVFALDTGCAWGHCLTLMRLDDQQRFSAPCSL
jgi:bis(5'-nucleosyl)-tetraphosphatase (symmetrical)